MITTTAGSDEGPKDVAVPAEAQICLGLPGLSGVSNGAATKRGKTKEYNRKEGKTRSGAGAGAG